MLRNSNALAVIAPTPDGQHAKLSCGWVLEDCHVAAGVLSCQFLQVALALSSSKSAPGRLLQYVPGAILLVGLRLPQVENPVAHQAAFRLEPARVA